MIQPKQHGVIIDKAQVKLGELYKKKVVELYNTKYKQFSLDLKAYPDIKFVQIEQDLLPEKFDQDYKKHHKNGHFYIKIDSKVYSKNDDEVFNTLKRLLSKDQTPGLSFEKWDTAQIMVWVDVFKEYKLGECGLSSILDIKTTSQEFFQEAFEIMPYDYKSDILEIEVDIGLLSTDINQGHATNQQNTIILERANVDWTLQYLFQEVKQDIHTLYGQHHALQNSEVVPQDLFLYESSANKWDIVTDDLFSDLLKKTLLAKHYSVDKQQIQKLRLKAQVPLQRFNADFEVVIDFGERLYFLPPDSFTGANGFFTRNMVLADTIVDLEHHFLALENTGCLRELHRNRWISDYHILEHGKTTNINSSPATLLNHWKKALKHAEQNNGQRKKFVIKIILTNDCPMNSLANELKAIVCAVGIKETVGMKTIVDGLVERRITTVIQLATLSNGDVQAFCQRPNMQVILNKNFKEQNH